MSIDHRDLTGNALHEPKSIETATNGAVYVANGSGSGTWTDIIATVANANLVPITVRIPDISTAGSVFVVSPFTGVVTDVHVVIHGALAAADSTITAKIATVPITGVAITCAYSGSAAGAVFSGTASALNTITSGQAIEIITDGGSTNTVSADVTILLDVSA